ncbi:MAG: 23S rRNA (pseudouridine(1915)-N(3))-methyltransferase RlmH [Bacilli bacterium]
MKINVIAVGKIKEDYLKMGINEYLKRLSSFANVEIIEVNDSPIKNDTPSEIKKVLESEGERILKHIKSDDYVIGLDLNKKQFDSIEFASYIDKAFVKGNSSITFVIGGSYGFSLPVKERFNDSFSLSKMTFIHQMTRLILLEQIYRAFKINRNETYHK